MRTFVTDGQTDGQTDRRTDGAGFIRTRRVLKIRSQHYSDATTYSAPSNLVMKETKMKININFNMKNQNENQKPAWLNDVHARC